MDHAELEYLTRRADEESKRAEAASSVSVAAIHRAMADAYKQQVKDNAPAPLRGT